MVFRLARFKYPTAKIFGLTTGHAVMKINSDLGFEPVPYASLPKEDAFWDGCKSCVNHPILESKVRTNCFCTAMLFDPAEIQVPKKIIPLNLKDRFWAVRKGGLK
jgi:hypothetical protein